MRNFFLLLYLIISSVNAGKISQHIVLTAQTQEFLLSIQNVRKDYISIQFLVFSPFQGIYDMNYKMFADSLSVLYDTLLLSKKTLLKKLKPINDISEIEIALGNIFFVAKCRLDQSAPKSELLFSNFWIFRTSIFGRDFQNLMIYSYSPQKVVLRSRIRS